MILGIMDTLGPIWEPKESPWFRAGPSLYVPGFKCVFRIVPWTPLASVHRSPDPLAGGHGARCFLCRGASMHHPILRKNPVPLLVLGLDFRFFGFQEPKPISPPPKPFSTALAHNSDVLAVNVLFHNQNEFSLLSHTDWQTNFISFQCIKSAVKQHAILC